MRWMDGTAVHRTSGPKSAKRALHFGERAGALDRKWYCDKGPQGARIPSVFGQEKASQVCQRVSCGSLADRLAVARDQPPFVHAPARTSQPEIHEADGFAPQNLLPGRRCRLSTVRWSCSAPAGRLAQEPPPLPGSRHRAAPAGEAGPHRATRFTSFA